MVSAQRDTGVANEMKVFKAHAAPLGLCDNLVIALKLLANQQKYGGSPTKLRNRPARKKQKWHHGRAEKLYLRG